MEERDDYWWDLRKTTFSVDVVVGVDRWIDLLATNFEVQKGPPYSIRISLEKNLHTSTPSAGTAIDAAELLRDRFDGLAKVVVSDAYVLNGLGRSIEHTEDTSAPWGLTLRLGGKDWHFTVDPSVPFGNLELEVVGIGLPFGT